MPLMDEDVGEELLDACVSGDFEQAQWILQNDSQYANWSEPERNVSILHTLAYHDLLEACKFLLSYGADPNQTNNNGETPLFWAVRMNCVLVVMTLLEHGADTNCLDKSGSSPLHYACCHAVPEVIPLLLAYQCDPDTRDVDGKTALETIEKEMDEDFFACTVLIRRHVKGMKNSCLMHGSTVDPSFDSVDNLHAFDVISTGSRVANYDLPRRKKFQVPRSFSPQRNVPQKPSFIAGSKTYYLHTPNSHSQLMHKKVLAATGDFTGMGNDPVLSPSDGRMSEPVSDSARTHKHAPSTPVCPGGKTPMLHEAMHRSFCSLTNDIVDPAGQDDAGANATDDGKGFGVVSPNPNKFLALESAAVRNRLREFEPKNLGQYFAMPFVPDSAVTERFDVIISVEHCYNCHLHGASVRHDKKKYATIADQCLRKVIVDVMKNCGHLRVVGLKAEAKPSRIGALEVCVAMFLPSKHKTSSTDSWEWKCKSIHSKLATKCWPKVGSLISQASDFVLEMLDLYGYSPLDELRDEASADAFGEAAKSHIKSGSIDDSYDFMREVIRPDIQYVTESTRNMQEALALIKEKRDIRAVSRKEIDQSYLLWVDRTYGDILLPEPVKKKVLPDMDNLFSARGVFVSAPPNTDRRDYICWSHATLKHFVVYDGRLRVQHHNVDVCNEDEALHTGDSKRIATTAS